VRPVTAATRLFALLGDPVAHSLSPEMQNAALRAADRDAVYVALRCDAVSVAPLMRALALAGGGGNVTLPHKSIAAAALEVSSDAVRRTDACNTFWGDDGRLCGENTDVGACAAAARTLVGELAGTRVLVLGAGGAAAAAVAALLDAGVRCIELRNRTATRAATLRARFGADRERIVLGEAGSGIVAGFDLIINATVLGLHADDALPLPIEPGLPPLLDLVYRKGGTHWVSRARAAGIRASDGREMLVRQGAAAYRLWFGEPAPIEIMRAAIEDADR
jgi:shikimate dehydrogenase